MPGLQRASGKGMADFRQLPNPPFNPVIRICQAATWFDGHLYVGGGRPPLSPRDSLEESQAGLGAEIARYDTRSGQWEIVYHSPLDEQGVALDRSVRAFCVFQGTTDVKPMLYAAVGSLQNQVRLLRSEDGSSFAECGEPGLGQGEADIAALRNLCPLNGSLYTSPVGKNKGRGWADDNVADSPVVFACEQPGLSGWHAASEPHFGDPNNESVNELIAFNDTLYAATLNRQEGFSTLESRGLSGS